MRAFKENYFKKKSKENLFVIWSYVTELNFWKEKLLNGDLMLLWFRVYLEK